MIYVGGMMTQKFVEGDKVICIICDTFILKEGVLYTITYSGHDFVRVGDFTSFFDPLRFRLATPLMEALV